MTATTTANGKPARARKDRAAARNAKAQEFAALPLLGEIVTWRPGSGDDRTHTKVLAALTTHGLGVEAERELTWETSFGRACKALESELMVDETVDHGDEIVYQITRRHLATHAGDEEKTEWAFTKVGYTRLETDSGKVTCKKDPDLGKKLTHETLRCKEARTGSDVTGVVQRLIDAYAAEHPTGDLIPIRDQGGAYLVLAEHAGFLTQLDGFLNDIGGKINRFPVPKGTASGDRSAADCVAEFLAGLVGEHRRAVKEFEITTRPDTVRAQAEQINATRVKVEAYAGYLAEQADVLLAEVEAANAELLSRVAVLDEERKNLPPEERVGMAGERERQVLAVLKTKPKKMAQIVKEAKLTDTCYNLLNKLAKDGAVVKSKDGYALPANA